MGRFKQKFENFEKALIRLSEAVNSLDGMSILEKEGLIQRFEYTLELAWKTLKEFLEEEGISAKSPKNVIRHAYALGIIESGDIWMEAIYMRNLTSHTYNEKLLEEAVSFVKEFFPHLKQLYKKLEIERKR